METGWSGQAFFKGKKGKLIAHGVTINLCSRVDAQLQEKLLFCHTYSLCFLNSAHHFLL